MSETLTTPATLWKAVWELANAWSRTPVVKHVAATMIRNQPLERRGSLTTGIPALLQHLEVTIGGLMHPLKYSSRIPVLMRDPILARFGAPQVDEAEWCEWLQNASRLEQAHQVTLAWLRSRLPGYPILRAPQLAPGTPLTTLEMTTEFTWGKWELASGLNRKATPSGVPDLLGADSTLGSMLEEAARQLATQLQRAPAWVRFDDTQKALDERAKEALREVRRELVEQLASDRIDEHEDERALPRLEYRAHTMTNVIDTLTGAARAYADAFTEVHRLLTLTTCDVFSQLTFYGEPWSIPVTNLAVPLPGESVLQFETPGALGLFIGDGQVIWLSNGVVADAVRIETRTYTFNQIQSSESFTARVLLGTGEGWPASTSRSMLKREERL